MIKLVSSPLLLLILLVPSLSCDAGPVTPAVEAPGPQPAFSQVHFEQLLHQVAEGWNSGDARLAADCFTDDAIYIEPPDKQKYSGSQQLYEFFGGDSGRSGQMSMTWRHIVFNPGTQVGAGEFTFKYGGTVHGVVMIKVRNGKISHWREYWYESDLEWPDFVGESAFDDNAG